MLIASDIVSLFDKDGDYQISREEYGTLAQYAAALFPTSAEALRQRFDDLAGNDGLISRAEVEESLRGAFVDE